MKALLSVLVAVQMAGLTFAQDNPLAKSSVGDWAKYLVTTKNETDPMKSTKDQQRWWAVANRGEGFVRIEVYTTYGERRVGLGGRLEYFKDRFEPLAGISRSSPMEVVSTTKDLVAINGRQYQCTKIVRRIDQPLDEGKMRNSWKGSSTVWISDEIPLGLARMENTYETRLSKSDRGQKLVETWTVAEFGLKSWVVK